MQLVKRGTQFALAMSGIAKATWGTSFQHVKRLYTAVVRPRTQYAAIVWHRPGDKTSPAQTQIKALTTVQRQAMKTMISTFRTTPTQTLQRETQTTPVHLSLENQILKSFTRMQTAPPTHPISLWLNRARQCQAASATLTTTFPSNLEHLIKQYPQYSNSDTPMEIIQPHIVPPWWEKPYSIHIDDSKAEAIKRHQERTSRDAANTSLISIYTDGSEIENEVGSAAYSPSTSMTMHHYLGTGKHANVFAAELIAIKLAMTIFDTHPNHDALTTYADSQSALRALCAPRRQSGQYILAEVLAAMEEIKRARPTSTLQLEWVPSHMGIQGNETADTEAKQAARDKLQHTQLPRRKLKAAQVTEINRHTVQSSRAQWIVRRANTLRATKTGIKIYGELTRKQATTLARLRSGHCGLNSYLHRFSIIEDPACDCGHRSETVQHYLLDCKNYNEPRDKLRTKVGYRIMHLEKLLGNMRYIKHTLQYVEETGRFDPQPEEHR